MKEVAPTTWTLSFSQKKIRLFQKSTTAKGKVKNDSKLTKKSWFQIMFQKNELLPEVFYFQTMNLRDRTRFPVILVTASSKLNFLKHIWTKNASKFLAIFLKPIQDLKQSPNSNNNCGFRFHYKLFGSLEVSFFLPKMKFLSRCLPHVSLVVKKYELKILKKIWTKIDS